MSMQQHDIETAYVGIGSTDPQAAARYLGELIASMQPAEVGGIVRARA
jgi:hypothetical protein